MDDLGDVYGDWYREKSALSAGTLLDRELEEQEAQRRQRETDDELYQRSLPLESMPVLKPLGNTGSGCQQKRSASGELGVKKRSRQ
ncbi:hypothetical protein HG537_0A08420 [Torulaspora globosa]|uniref:Uncharacterized protein n=1 Tax=Torulaspora globosa TaxID=48254 RepID=A0A7H9HQH7_9SACH|nr:hypothetical protein HG537_0A08420 [Torulaspora sp. CBS 2947]